MIYGAGTARVKHAVTGEVFAIAFDAVEMQEADDDALADVIFIEHAALGRLIWRVTGDAMGIGLTKRVDLNGHELVEDFDFISDLEPDASG